MSVEQDKAPESWADSMKAVAAELEATAPTSDPVAESTEQTAAEPETRVVEGDAQQPAPEVTEPAGDDQLANAPADAAPESGDPPALDPLKHWTKADQERFTALDDGAKEFVLDRAKTLEKTQLDKHREIDAQGRQYQAVLGALDPFKDQMTRMGVSPEQAVAQIASRWNQLQSSPGEALTELARQYGPSMGAENGRLFAQTILQAVGLSPDALLDEHSPELDSPEANAIADVRREIQELRAERQQDRSTQVQSQQAAAQQQIDGFSTATNGNSGLAHPHFDALQANMGALIQAGLAKGLDDAYDKALALSPELQPPVPKPNGKPVTISSVAASSPAPGNPAREPAKDHKTEVGNVAREFGLA